MSLHHLSNSAILVDRTVIEAVQEMLVSAANAMLLSASLLTDRLDQHDGDPDLEDNNDREASDGDGRDAAWVEWTTMRGSQKRSPNIAPPEDDEEDGEDCAHDEGEPDMRQYRGEGAGCPISDPGGDEHDGREEQERLTPVYGVSQTGLPLNLNSWRGEQVPDFPCGPVFPVGR